MNRFTIIVALAATSNMSVDAHALPGPAPPYTTIAEYDFSTGQIVVSYNGVGGWSLESASSDLTGDPPPVLPLAAPDTDTDMTIGDAGIGVATATNLDLGNVAAPGLPPGDLQLFWYCGLGDGGCHPSVGPVVYVNIPVPEPTTFTLATLALLTIAWRPRLRRQFDRGVTSDLSVRSLHEK